MKKLNQIIRVFLVLFPCFSANAQVVYVDVNPDSCVCVGGPGTNSRSTGWDLDNDGTYDFNIDVSSMGNSGGLNKTSIIGLANNSVAFGSGGALRLNVGDTIFNQLSWQIGTSELEDCGVSGYFGNWHTPNDGYAAVEFYNGITLYYGWIRLNVFAGTASAMVIVKDYAYSTSLVLAGYGDPNSIKQNNNSQTSFVYPNPISYESKIKIDRIHNTESRDLKIYDTNGMLVRVILFKPFEEIIIHKNQLCSGIYFYKISSNEIPITSGKFAIE